MYLLRNIFKLYSNFVMCAWLYVINLSLRHLHFLFFRHFLVKTFKKSHPGRILRVHFSGFSRPLLPPIYWQIRAKRQRHKPWVSVVLKIGINRKKHISSVQYIYFKEVAKWYKKYKRPFYNRVNNYQRMLNSDSILIYIYYIEISIIRMANLRKRS